MQALCLKPQFSPSTAHVTYKCRCERCVQWFREYHRNYHKNNDYKRRKQISKRSMLWLEAHPERKLGIYLKHTYKITLEQFKALLLEQGNVCAICKEESHRRLCVDHNHKTGKIRGLLCDKCNKGLGQFKDKKERLILAASYLASNE